jgi:hypothetical protein
MEDMARGNTMGDSINPAATNGLIISSPEEGPSFGDCNRS